MKGEHHFRHRRDDIGQDAQLPFSGRSASVLSGQKGLHTDKQMLGRVLEEIN